MTESAPVPATEVDTAKVSLDDWCRQKSKQLGKKVELLAGFHFSEKTEGRVLDTAKNFAQRFEEFAGAESSPASK